MARGAYEAALAYAKEREQFGRPIAEFEAIQFYLADMATEIDAARLLTERAAAAQDAGRARRRWSPARRSSTRPRSPCAVADRAVQIHGGYGYIKDYPGREVLPRRQALHDRRGDERDPAARHRQATALERLMTAAARGRLGHGSSPRGVLAGQSRPIGRAISEVERESGAASRILRLLFRGPGARAIVGITGPPGAGKSTLVQRLAQAYPGAAPGSGSSRWTRPRPFTGGAILGDRIRMPRSAPIPASSSARWRRAGTLGGLARATRDAVDVLDAAGFDVVLVETVGVGQDEVDIVRAADTTAVVLVPGLGDDIQAIKAGILEIADVFVVNKADREGADRAVGAGDDAGRLAPTGAWRPADRQDGRAAGRGRSRGARGDRVARQLARRRRRRARPARRGARGARLLALLEERFRRDRRGRAVAAARRPRGGDAPGPWSARRIRTPRPSGLFERLVREPAGDPSAGSG